MGGKGTGGTAVDRTACALQRGVKLERKFGEWEEKHACEAVSPKSPLTKKRVERVGSENEGKENESDGLGC